MVKRQGKTLSELSAILKARTLPAKKLNLNSLRFSKGVILSSLDEGKLMEEFELIFPVDRKGFVFYSNELVGEICHDFIEFTNKSFIEKNITKVVWYTPGE